MPKSINIPRSVNINFPSNFSSDWNLRVRISKFSRKWFYGCADNPSNVDEYQIRNENGRVVITPVQEKKAWFKISSLFLFTIPSHNYNISGTFIFNSSTENRYFRFTSGFPHISGHWWKFSYDMSYPLPNSSNLFLYVAKKFGLLSCFSSIVFGHYIRKEPVIILFLNQSV